jgi:hypothetical protein
MTFTGGVFVGHQVLLNVGFGVAQARLTRLVHDRLLVTASQDVYGAAITRFAELSPPGPGEVSRLVRVQARDVVTEQESATLTLRWQASATDGAVFPALDADIRLAPAGDQAAVLTLDGAYRPPPGAGCAGLDEVLLHGTATAAVQDFLDRMAAAIASPDAARPGQQAGPAEPERSGPPVTDPP